MITQVKLFASDTVSGLETKVNGFLKELAAKDRHELLNTQFFGMAAAPKSSYDSDWMYCATITYGIIGAFEMTQS